MYKPEGLIDLISRIAVACPYHKLTVVLLACLFLLGYSISANAGTVYGYVDCDDACSSPITLTFSKGGDVKEINADSNHNYKTYLRNTGEYTVTIESDGSTWTRSIRSSSRARRQDINLR